MAKGSTRCLPLVCWAALGAALTACGASEEGDSKMNGASAGSAGTMSVAGTSPTAGTTAGTLPVAGMSSSAGSAGTMPSAGNSAGSSGAAGAGGAGGMMAAGSGGMAGAIAGSSGAAGTSDAGSTAGTGNGGSPLPPITDYSDEGPFATTTESSTGPDGAYTIFRPDPLGTDGFVHSPLVYGPGVATSGATSYTTLLGHLASHGFVIISVNTFGFSGPGAPAHIEAMKVGLEWLIAQNDEAGVYQGKLAVDRAVAMGYSLGATASALLASHPAIMTTVAIHGHMQMTGAEPHGPMLLLTGTEDVIDQVRATVSAVSTAPVIMGAIDGQDHLSVIPSQLAAGAPELTAMTAWLRYWVNGDENAKSYFWGDSCTMCSAPWIAPESNALWDALGL